MINLTSQRANRYLTDFSVGCRPQDTDTIAGMLFPTKAVDVYPSGYIADYPISDWHRDEAHERTPRTESKGASYSTGRLEFNLRHYSFHDEYDRDELASVESPFSLDRDKTEYVTGKLWLKREIECADSFFVSSVWGTDATAGTTPGYDKWDDLATRVPLQIATLREAVALKCGREPDVGVIGAGAFFKAQWNPSMIDLIKYTQRGVITEELFASLCGLRKLMVGRAIECTSPRGTAEAQATFARVWGKNFLCAYSPDRPTQLQPSAGLTITMRAARMVGNVVRRDALQFIEKFEFPERNHTVRIEANAYWQMKLTKANAGGFIASITD